MWPRPLYLVSLAFLDDFGHPLRLLIFLIWRVVIDFKFNVRVYLKFTQFKLYRLEDLEILSGLNRHIVQEEGTSRPEEVVWIHVRLQPEYQCIIQDYV